MNSDLTRPALCCACDEEREIEPTAYAHSDCVQEGYGTYTLRLHISEELLTKGGFATYSQGTVWAIRYLDNHARQEYERFNCL